VTDLQNQKFWLAVPTAYCTVMVTVLLGKPQSVALTVDDVPEVAVPMVPTPPLIVITLVFEMFHVTIFTTSTPDWVGKFASAVKLTVCPMI